MTKITNLECPKCGARIPTADSSADCHEDNGVLFVRYDATYMSKVILVDTGSGLRHVVDDWGKQPSKPASRQLGGIIGPY
jgi:hypothetical protein